jgi:hypothetical protein
MRSLSKITVGLAVMLILACSTVTIRPGGGERDMRDPTFTKRENFFFWGLAGESHVDVKKICGDKAVKQMQSQNTFMDGFLGVITLGIYAPRSVNVWCK